MIKNFKDYISESSSAGEIEIELIDGQVIDTYGGDYTYRDVWASIEGGEVDFYERIYGPGSSETDGGSYKIDDENEIKELMNDLKSHPKYIESIKESNRLDDFEEIGYDEYKGFYNDLLKCFVKETPDDDIYNEYLRGKDHLIMQDFVSSNLKPEFDWLTGIGVMDAVEFMIKDAISNGNLSDIVNKSSNDSKNDLKQIKDIIKNSLDVEITDRDAEVIKQNVQEEVNRITQLKRIQKTIEWRSGNDTTFQQIKNLYKEIEKIL